MLCVCRKKSDPNYDAEKEKQDNAMYKKITAFRKNVANGKKPKVEKALVELDDIRRKQTVIFSPPSGFDPPSISRLSDS